MNAPAIEEQIRAVLEREALNENSRKRVLIELLKAMSVVRGSDLAENLKAGSGDLASKPGSGDLAGKSGSGDLAGKPGNNLGASARMVGVIQAAAALGRAKALIAELRLIEQRLAAGDRGRLQKVVNNLETALAELEQGSGAYLGASGLESNGRAIHIHLHVEG